MMEGDTFILPVLLVVIFVSTSLCAVYFAHKGERVE
jgi:hypothetical protein